MLWDAWLQSMALGSERPPESWLCHFFSHVALTDGSLPRACFLFPGAETYVVLSQDFVSSEEDKHMKGTQPVARHTSSCSRHVLFTKLVSGRAGTWPKVLGLPIQLPLLTATPTSAEKEN